MFRARPRIRLASTSMASRDDPMFEITPQVLLKAYSCGIFPMAESADDPALYWIEPQQRGVLPLDGLHIPRRLLRTVRTTSFTVKVDNNYDRVIDGCAAPRAGRMSTWINTRIRALYRDLFERGACHTVEVWDGDRIVGGLYGVALKSAFFGESMFSTERDASKIALVHLIARLIRGGFSLLDTQFVTEHLRQFGTIELDRATFQAELEKALEKNADFYALPIDASGAEVAAIISAALDPPPRVVPKGTGGRTLRCQIPGIAAHPRACEGACASAPAPQPEATTRRHSHVDEIVHDGSCGRLRDLSRRYRRCKCARPRRPRQSLLQSPSRPPHHRRWLRIRIRRLRLLLQPMAV